MLDLPTRADIDALNARLDRLTEALCERPPLRGDRPPVGTRAESLAESDPD